MLHGPPAEFKRATDAVFSAADLERGMHGLTELQVKILFELFDVNHDGVIDRSEFLDIMQARASRGLDQVRLPSVRTVAIPPPGAACRCTRVLHARPGEPFKLVVAVRHRVIRNAGSAWATTSQR